MMQTQQTTCTHRNDSLYPRSLYRCDACGEVHSTRAYAGAVNWQCPNELWSGTVASHNPAHQTYIGYSCVLCSEYVLVSN